MTVSNDVKYDRDYFIWLTKVAISGHCDPHYGTLLGYLDLEEGTALRSIARRLIFGIEDEIGSISVSEKELFTKFNQAVDPDYPHYIDDLNPLFKKYQKCGSHANGIAHYHQLKRAAVIFKWDYSLSSLMENKSFVSADSELATILLQWAMMHDVSNIYSGNLPTSFTFLELDDFVSALEYLISLKLCFFGAESFDIVYPKFLEFAKTAGDAEFEKFRWRLDLALIGAIGERDSLPMTGASLLQEEKILKLSATSPAISKELGERMMLPGYTICSEEEYLSGVMLRVKDEEHCGLEAVQYVNTKCPVRRWTSWSRNKDLRYMYCGSQHSLFSKLVKYLDPHCTVNPRKPTHRAVKEYVSAYLAASKAK